eukprot:gene4421-3774_t
MRLRLFSAERERVMHSGNPDYTNPLFDRTTRQKEALLKDNCAATDHPDDCKALSAFAYATHFMNWKVNTNWMLGDSYCTWYGVRCNGAPQTPPPPPRTPTP